MSIENIGLLSSGSRSQQNVFLNHLMPSFLIMDYVCVCPGMGGGGGEKDGPYF